jgi:hypothetical protein
MAMPNASFDEAMSAAKSLMPERFCAPPELALFARHMAAGGRLRSECPEPFKMLTQRIAAAKEAQKALPSR